MKKKKPTWDEDDFMDDQEFEDFVMDNLTHQSYYKPTAPCTSNLDAVLPWPTYTDEMWKEPQTIFLIKGDPDTGEYDDHLRWDDEKHVRGMESRTEPDKRNARSIQKYLIGYYERPIQLIEVKGMVNWTSGHPVYFYTWKWLDKE